MSDIPAQLSEPMTLMRTKDVKHLADRIEELEAKLAKVVEALTPSGDTKAAYSGEFHITVYAGEDESGGEVFRKVPVDWTTIKAIMAMIKARAALAPLQGDKK